MMLDQQKSEISSDDNNSDNQVIEVFCAWCNKHLYDINSPHKDHYSKSHGICQNCVTKYFSGVE